jgi:HNH endonuclease/NUMOD4 motif-containing protein
MSIVDEIWRPAPGLPGYEVSNHGRVRSWRPLGGAISRRRSMLASTPRLLKQHLNKGGYLEVAPQSGSRCRTVRVHALVLGAFVGPRPDGYECCHRNGNRQDNRLENLRWDTHVANIADREGHGTTARGLRNGAHTRPSSRRVGSLNGQAVLNEGTVRLARYLSVVHGVPGCVLAKWFGISNQRIWCVLNGVSWKHVPMQSPLEMRES